ncbi:DUF418 domain-containing protein [Pontimicrobium aquaticum]|uniref:DUF418 domain-containing protein n=1 Tax=Pontimicrobium aquaticum TaxID=2565367 RepID=A0A4U0F2Y1_9FLAO|nr:DUF418 domain-containing protein [Pontimicrobium aquaticum]TJY37072.1 DUF418 domain-containing protein [Pontimicrobium aquaticum]
MTQSSKRYFELDAIRGFAICGIFMVNIVYFAYPTERLSEVFAPSLYWYSNMLNFIKDDIIGGRTATIFAFLFGLGMGMQWNKWQNFGFLLRRNVVLSFIGLFHIVLLFHGDILLDYALFGLIGTLLLRFVKKQSFFLFLGVAIALYSFVLMILQHYGWVSRGTYTSSLQIDVNEKILLFQKGNFLEQCWFRVRYYLSIRQMPWVRNFYFPPVMACYVFGLYVSKTKFLSNFTNKHLYKKILSFTIVYKIVIAVFDLGFVSSTFKETLGYNLLMYIDQFSTSLLLLSAIVLACQYGFGKSVLKPLTVLGKTSLSSYILQSVTASILFFSIGFGQYNLLSPGQVQVCMLLLIVLIYFLNKICLNYMGQGLLEKMWRKLAISPKK